MGEIINFRTKLVEMNLVLITAMIISLSFASSILSKVRLSFAILSFASFIFSIVFAVASILFLLLETLEEEKEREKSEKERKPYLVITTKFFRKEDEIALLFFIIATFIFAFGLTLLILFSTFL
jgi:hypothetical protein